MAKDTNKNNNNSRCYSYYYYCHHCYNSNTKNPLFFKTGEV